MSRLARRPLEIPNGVDFKLEGQQVLVKGKNGEFKLSIHESVSVDIDGNMVTVKAKQGNHPMVGTIRKLLGNFVKGVSEGFVKKLSLVGVGYRVKLDGEHIELSLGYSKPIKFKAPAGINLQIPSNTEILVTGADAQLVGEVAAKIRAFRPPEPYKGKGVRYADEVVIIKETKKK